VYIILGRFCLFNEYIKANPNLRCDESIQYKYNTINGKTENCIKTSSWKQDYNPTYNNRQLLRFNRNSWNRDKTNNKSVIELNSLKWSQSSITRFPKTKHLKKSNHASTKSKVNAMTASACSKKHQCQIRTCRLSSIWTVLYLKKKQGLFLDSHYIEICFTLICICSICVICFTLICICSICVICFTLICICSICVICFTLICICSMCVICFTLICICSICVIKNKCLIFLLYWNHWILIIMILLLWRRKGHFFKFHIHFDLTDIQRTSFIICHYFIVK
jgi:hypothetical protein